MTSSSTLAQFILHLGRDVLWETVNRLVRGVGDVTSANVVSYIGYIGFRPCIINVVLVSFSNYT